MHTNVSKDYIIKMVDLFPKIDVNSDDLTICYDKDAKLKFKTSLKIKIPKFIIIN